MAQEVARRVPAPLDTRRALDSIERRIESLVSTWPPELAAEFRGYRHERCGDSWVDREPPTSGVDGSYWLVFPGLLLRRYAGRAEPIAAGLLDELLWGQYCLFLAVRTEDDLLDGQAGSRRVEGAVRRLEDEAARAFARHLPRASPFWSVYREAIEVTRRAITRADRMQRSAAGMPADSLDCHARIAEIFKLGSAAVCFSLGRREVLGRLGRACDHLAVASQLLDDLVDLEEDQELGRRSFAISWILRRGRQHLAAGEDSPSGVWPGVVQGDAVKELLELARRELRRAGRAMAPLNLPAADGYMDLLLAEVDLFERHLHRARVDLALPRSPAR